jgi:glucose-1-phosphate cytidylyltransferase
MKVVILAGGFGTRLSEETSLKPKPMVQIGGKPMLWHIMKIYSAQGFNEFIICLGYKGYVIKEYFANYFLHQSDVTFDIANNEMEIHNTSADPWKVTLVDTGLNTMTGGRVKRVKDYIADQPFMLTYGDGVGDVNLPELVRFHNKKEGLVTVTSVQPSGRFGTLNISDQGQVNAFEEKPKGERGWINGGFFVCDPSVIQYIEDDTTIWERNPMETIANEGKMFAYLHDGYWKCMDTLRDKNELETTWTNKDCPWRLWK